MKTTEVKTPNNIKPDNTTANSKVEALNSLANGKNKTEEINKPVTDEPQSKEQAGSEKAFEVITIQPENRKAEGKTEIKFEKPAMNLESTLKLVEELHRRKLQRERLLDTITTLEAFEVAQQDDAEETDTNHFQGCALTIEDDDRRKFTTKNPVIIFSVAQYVNSLCVNRLAEIEAGITIPA